MVAVGFARDVTVGQQESKGVLIPVESFLGS